MGQSDGAAQSIRPQIRAQLLNSPHTMCRQLSMQDLCQNNNIETAKQSVSAGYGWCSLDGDR